MGYVINFNQVQLRVSLERNAELHHYQVKLKLEGSVEVCIFLVSRKLVGSSRAQRLVVNFRQNIVCHRQQRKDLRSINLVLSIEDVFIFLFEVLYSFHRLPLCKNIFKYDTDYAFKEKTFRLLVQSYVLYLI